MTWTWPPGSDRILVVDEPTGDLDPSNALKIEALLRSLRDEHGISVVVALHDMDMAARLRSDPGRGRAHGGPGPVKRAQDRGAPQVAKGRARDQRRRRAP